jgi:Na+-translocating ferredoxin:NAD+ oxidoreductase subunit B
VTTFVEADLVRLPQADHLCAIAIDALLPQTQCTRCGFSGCQPYAQAIAAGSAPINQCPPGGARTIAALAELLNTPVLALNPAHGVEAPLTVAHIVEDACIGCMKCILVCPVDAIIGQNKRMHTVIAAECTGCELCIPACPVDCITLLPDPAGRLQITPDAADHARRRFEARNQRVVTRAAQLAARIEAKRLAIYQTPSAT